MWYTEANSGSLKEMLNIFGIFDFTTYYECERQKYDNYLIDFGAPHSSCM